MKKGGRGRERGGKEKGTGKREGKRKGGERMVEKKFITIHTFQG